MGERRKKDRWKGRRGREGNREEREQEGKGRGEGGERRGKERGGISPPNENPGYDPGYGNIPTGTPYVTGASNAMGYEKIRGFRSISRFISEMIDIR